MGWSPDRIRIIDDDLGQSAARHVDRSGFAGMVGEAALGDVGLILGIEVSRLSRGNRDWYHLLDICAVTGTLIGDGEGLYDPGSYNDRLLLGLKGTMSEAELHVMKQRLVEAMRSKAKRGEFRFRLAPGYVWDEAGRMQKDADDRVRSAIELIFQRFDEIGALHSVQTSLAEEGIVVPSLKGPGRELRWGPPSENYVRRVLTNPLYAGAYAYGRRGVEEVLDAAQRPRKRVRERPREQWPVLIRDHHEGYISWERFEGNQRRIASNRRGAGVGAPREGASLLQGLVLCARCGRRMKVGYSRRPGILRYSCVGGRRQTGMPVCQSFGAVRLERAVERLLLDALDPVGVEAMIEAAAEHTKATEAERVHWRQRVEHARYEANLAARQYGEVDPQNRLVARELERRWETAMRAQEEAEREAEVRLGALEGALTDEEKRQLRAYAEDLGSLWTANGTRSQDRKRIVRCLIENVVAGIGGETERLQAAVHWAGGEVTNLDVARGKSGVHRYVTDPELVDLVRVLAEEFSDEQIARILHRKRLRTAKGLAFTAQRVTILRRTHDIAGTIHTRPPEKDTYTAQQAADLLGVNHTTAIRWVEVGLLKASQATEGAPWRIHLTEDDRKRLMEAEAPAGWLPLKAAAAVLSSSQQTVLQRLQAGQLDGIRVRVGRRSGWRIRVPATTSDVGPTLFDTPRS